MQDQLTQSQMQIEIISNRADAELAKARKDAERRVVTAKADSESVALEGRGKSESVSLIGGAEANVLSQKVQSFGDGRLYAISLVADSLAHSQQPLVPATALGGDGSQGGMLGTLMSLLVADKLGVPVPTRHSQPPRGRAAEGVNDVAPLGLAWVRPARCPQGRCPWLLHVGPLAQALPNVGSAREACRSDCDYYIKSVFRRVPARFPSVLPTVF